MGYSEDVFGRIDKDYQASKRQKTKKAERSQLYKEALALAKLRRILPSDGVPHRVESVRTRFFRTVASVEEHKQQKLARQQLLMFNYRYNQRPTAETPHSHSFMELIRRWSNYDSFPWDKSLTTYLTGAARQIGKTRFYSTPYSMGTKTLPISMLRPVPYCVYSDMRGFTGPDNSGLADIPRLERIGGRFILEPIIEYIRPKGDEINYRVIKPYDVPELTFKLHDTRTETNTQFTDRVQTTRHRRSYGKKRASYFR